jgi:hypothetical protein
MTATQGPTPQTVGILLFPDVEILDFFGPFHVFSRTARPPRMGGGPERWLFTVLGIAETADLITSRAGPSLGGHGRGLQVQPIARWTIIRPLTSWWFPAVPARGRCWSIRWSWTGLQPSTRQVP